MVFHSTHIRGDFKPISHRHPIAKIVLVSRFNLFSPGFQRRPFALFGVVPTGIILPSESLLDQAAEHFIWVIGWAGKAFGVGKLAYFHRQDSLLPTLHKELASKDISVGDALALRLGQCQRELVRLSTGLLLSLKSLNLSQDAFPFVDAVLVEANPLLMALDPALMKPDFVQDGIGDGLVHNEYIVSPVPALYQPWVFLGSIRVV
jgi:hypothetical protein